MRQARSLDRVALALMLLCCMSWGLQQVLAKLALAEVPPITQAAIRSVGGTIIIGGWSWWRDPSVFRRDGTLWPGIAAGVLFALEFLALFIGLAMDERQSRGALSLHGAVFRRARRGLPLAARALARKPMARPCALLRRRGDRARRLDATRDDAGARRPPHPRGRRLLGHGDLDREGDEVEHGPGRQGSALPARRLRRAPRARRFHDGRELADAALSRAGRELALPDDLGCRRHLSHLVLALAAIPCGRDVRRLPS